MTVHGLRNYPHLRISPHHEPAKLGMGVSYETVRDWTVKSRTTS